jgi:hypothetical protein
MRESLLAEADRERWWRSLEQRHAANVATAKAASTTKTRRTPTTKTTTTTRHKLPQRPRIPVVGAQNNAKHFGHGGHFKPSDKPAFVTCFHRDALPFETIHNSSKHERPISEFTFREGMYDAAAHVGKMRFGRAARSTLKLQETAARDSQRLYADGSSKDAMQKLRRKAHHSQLARAVDVAALLPSRASQATAYTAERLHAATHCKPFTAITHVETLLQAKLDASLYLTLPLDAYVGDADGDALRGGAPPTTPTPPPTSTSSSTMTMTTMSKSNIKLKGGKAAFVLNFRPTRGGVDCRDLNGGRQAPRDTTLQRHLASVAATK